MNYEFVTPPISTCALRIYDLNKKTDKIYLSDWHSHREYEIILVLSGTKHFYINNEEIKLDLGDIIFVDSNIPHKTISPVGSSSVILQFNISSYTDLLNEVQLDSILGKTRNSYTVFKSNSILNAEITNCISKIRHEYANQENYFEYFIRSYLYELIAILYRNEILTDYNEYLGKMPQLIPVFKYINDHYKEHISLDDISGVANLHSSYFCKTFKKALGISFIEYLNLFRLNKAKKLMKETQKNITEISYDVGFSSVSYFIKTFRKYNYCSPNRYRSHL